MKKLISLFLALMLVLSVTVTASADETTYGTITISGASAENTYTVYRLLDLESYDVDSGAYSYKVNADWAGFFATDAAKAYFSVDSVGYATWVGDESADRVIAFSQLALQYAKDNDIAYIQCSEDLPGFITTADDVTSGKFADLPLGYYLVDSTMGALCGLTTTNPHATITAKNKTPGIDKQVQEDSNTHWGATNSASIGETVNYRVTINVTGGAENYVLHDTMSEGLTFQPESVSVTLNGSNVEKEGNFEVNAEPGDGCTFDITFSKSFCNALKDGDEVIAHYQAVLTEKAAIGNESTDENKVRLEYGEEHFTEYDSVQTHTYGIEIIKTDDQGTKLLDGAEFRIYDAETGGNEIPVVAEKDSSGNVIRYRLAREGETGEVIIVKDGRIKVDGFDNNLPSESYWLEETAAPEGYNQLTTRQAFRINSQNLYGTFVDGTYSAGTGVQVKNKTGSMLPTTGAMGTTMFLTFGSLVVLATGVLLVTKKRMSMIEE